MPPDADADPWGAPVDPTDDPAIDSHMTESVITRVYLALVQQPTPSRTLLVAQGLPSSTVDRALGVLNARGLIRLTAADTWEVVPPDIALPAHAAELERRARAVRGAAHELSQVFFQARTGDQPQTEGVRSLRTPWTSCTRPAPRSSALPARRVRAMRDRSRRTEALFAAPLARTVSGPSRRTAPSCRCGRRTRSPCSTSWAPARCWRRGPTAASSSGSSRRCRSPSWWRTRTPPWSTSRATTRPAVARCWSATPRWCAASRELVEAVWRLGTPAGRARTAGLDRRDTTILTLLAAGASDATIARQSGISQRTVERRVRALMDQLGAGTRFQAGVQAARRGWL